jgi:hypothetical protein
MAWSLSTLSVQTGLGRNFGEEDKPGRTGVQVELSAIISAISYQLSAIRADGGQLLWLIADG